MSEEEPSRRDFLKNVAKGAAASIVASNLPDQAEAQRPAAAPAQRIVFPRDAGFINVKNEKYGAKGDGRTDDTQAILRALNDSGQDTRSEFWHDKIVYFPAGTYMVSDRLLKRYRNGGFASGMIMM